MLAQSQASSQLDEKPGSTCDIYAINTDGYAANTERAPLTNFTIDQHNEKLVEVSGGYGGARH